MHTGFAELNDKMNARFADMDHRITDVHKSIADVHKAITVQTRWFLTAAVAIAVLYPLVGRLTAWLGL